MTTTLAALVLALQAVSVTAPEAARTVTVSVTDKAGGPVAGLSTEEVVVLENGVARDVSRLEPDTRPLLVAVIVDSSGPISSLYRLNVVEDVVRFLRRLPEGSRFAVWTTGDRPTRLVDFTDDVAQASRALKHVSPQGGNTVFDAILEAADDLKHKEGERTAVVVVSGNGLGFSNYDRTHVVDRALGTGHTFMTVNFREGAAPGDPGFGGGDSLGRVGQVDYDHVFSALADKSGGLRESPLSAMAVGRALDKVAAALGSRYRITYGTVPDLKKRKVEVKVARPGVEVSLGGPRS